MAPLKNVKHEAFARNIATSPRTGMSQGQAYEQAGYTASGHSAEQLGSQLLRKVEVQRRIAELTAPAVRKARVSVESLLCELEQTIGDARADGHHATVVSALTLSAKLVGLLRDQVEIGGPGSFAGLKTPEEVVEVIREELGDDAVRMLLEARAGDNARLVSPRAVT